MKQLSTQLKIVLKNYHRLVDSLEVHEQSLLEENLRQLKRNMQTGTQRLPWTSTNHEKFITVTSEVNHCRRILDCNCFDLDDFQTGFNNQSNKKECSRYSCISG